MNKQAGVGKSRSTMFNPNAILDQSQVQVRTNLPPHPVNMPRALPSGERPHPRRKRG